MNSEQIIAKTDAIIADARSDTESNHSKSAGFARSQSEVARRQTIGIVALEESWQYRAQNPSFVRLSRIMRSELAAYISVGREFEQVDDNTLKLLGVDVESLA